jgi:ubiquinone/menaquinone biosynthesis C-methylase UbiE
VSLDVAGHDAHVLPFPDAELDAVVSAAGVMLAPRRAAAEVLRVCRPGGTIAMAGWAPEGLEDRVRELLAGSVGDLAMRREDGFLEVVATRAYG